MRKDILFLGILVSILFTAVSFAAEDKTLMTKAPDEIAAVRSVATDTNKDGKPDRWEYYSQGLLTRVEADSNYDGKVDEKGTVENGKISKVEKDSDYDGKPDKWVTY